MTIDRRLTAEEAVAWALDPRNDNGDKNAIYVMAFTYDMDCPNGDDHVGYIIEANEGFWQVGGGWGEEADATLFTDDKHNALSWLTANGTDVHVVDEPCRCWDGITEDDVATWTDEDTGRVDLDGFGEWGPFRLVADIDPVAPRALTAQEALDRIASRLEAYESHVGNQGLSRRMSDAIDALHAFINKTDDLDWGEAGECREHLADEAENDGDEELTILYNGVVAAQSSDKLGELEAAEAALDDYVTKNGYGRHYGIPHCIWCLQAQ